ncbi:hypothetical protein U1Q18_022197 [Sarracenia purpurea var. burkii]
MALIGKLTSGMTLMFIKFFSLSKGRAQSTRFYSRAGREEGADWKSPKEAPPPHLPQQEGTVWKSPKEASQNKGFLTLFQAMIRS